jgi:hypothetical protein
MRSAAKLAVAESVRQADMLLIPEYMPTPSASSRAIDRTCIQRLRASRIAHAPQNLTRFERLIAHHRRLEISTCPPCGGPS